MRYSYLFRSFLLSAFSLLVGVTAATNSFGQGDNNNNNNNNNNNPAAGVAGIEIDATGVLRVTQVDPSVAIEQRMAAMQSQPRGSVRTSAMRKVSLTRLEKYVAEQIEKGNELDTEVLGLAGLTRLEYVFYLPDSKDIVIAGPADQCYLDANNRLVGLNTGKSTLRLEDLVVALRAFSPKGGATMSIGCSIDPTQEGLKRMNQYNSQFGGQYPVGMSVQQLASGMRDSLGLQTVSIRGIPRSTHFAQVMIEADYRMKLIGIGLQDPMVPMKTWIELTRPGANSNALQRWYFEADYSSIATNEEGTAMHLKGQGVKLTGELEGVTKSGTRTRTGVSGDPASKTFTQEFTQKFDQLAEVSPVFYEMRNLFDVSIAAAFIQDRGLYAKSGWDQGVFADESKFSVDKADVINQVESAINAVWKDSQLITPIGGGIHIAARKLVDPSRVKVDKQIDANREKLSAPADLAADQWWWD